MTLIANIALLVAALFDMIVFLGGDITAHRNNGHVNDKYYRWLSQSGELSSPKRLLLIAVFFATFTTMAQQSWMVIMILAATLLIQGIVLLKQRQWKLMDWDKRTGRMLVTAVILALIAIGAAVYYGSLTSLVFASRVSGAASVLILFITPLLTMLAAWLLSPFDNEENKANQ